MKTLQYIFLGLLIGCYLISNASGQSLDIKRPTPVRTENLSGEVSPRDIGDARLTAYFYTFEAENGDLEVSVTSKNFDGDFDIFEADSLRPIGKIKVFADEEAAIKRTFYFRQNARVILRVEGRSPNDEKAEFTVKFGGTFAFSKLPDVTDEDLPKLDAPTIDENRGGVRVNSVGSVIEVIKPKPKPTPTPTSKPVKNPAASAKARTKITPRKNQNKNESDNERVGKSSEQSESINSPRKNSDAGESSKDSNANNVARKKPSQTVRLNRKKAIAPTSAKSAEENNKTAKSSDEVSKMIVSTKTPRLTPKKSPRNSRRNNSNSSVTSNASALAGFRLIIILKNGEILSKPMSDVKRVNVENAELIVEFESGKTEKHSILNVLRFSIEQ